MFLVAVLFVLEKDDFWQAYVAQNSLILKFVLYNQAA
jgi:hypothetical protein